MTDSIQKPEYVFDRNYANFARTLKLLQQLLRCTARLVGDLAAITSTLTMTFADLMFRLMSSEPVERLQQRFCVALQAVDTINDLSVQPLVLRYSFFSEEHRHLTARLLEAFTGSAGVLPCPPDHGNIFLVAARPFKKRRPS
jgi:hypothetical protein